MNQATTLTSQVITGIREHQTQIGAKENEIRTENRMQSPQFRSPVLPHCEFQKNESIIWVIIGERAGPRENKKKQSDANLQRKSTLKIEERRRDA